MNIIVSSGAFPGYSLENCFRVIAEAGADGIELLLTPRSSMSPRHIRALENAYRIPVRSVHTTLRLRRGSVAQIHQDIIQTAKLVIALDACEVQVVHTPETYSLHSPATQSWFHAIEKAATIARDGGFELGIENSGKLTDKTPTWYFDHPHQLLRLTQEWDLGITYDTAHAASRDWDLLQMGRMFRPRLKNVHLSDLSRRNSRVGLVNALLRDHQIPGTGALPLNDLLREQHRAGYHGLITLELSPVAVRAWRPTVAKRLLRDAVEACRAHTVPPSRRPSRHHLEQD